MLLEVSLCCGELSAVERERKVQVCLKNSCECCVAILVLVCVSLVVMVGAVRISLCCEEVQWSGEGKLKVV